MDLRTFESDQISSPDCQHSDQSVDPIEFIASIVIIIFKICYAYFIYVMQFKSQFVYFIPLSYNIIQMSNSTKILKFISILTRYTIFKCDRGDRLID